MILVDLEVPSMRKSYQFRLEETCMVGTLITEIAEMICQKEHCQLLQGEDKLELYSMENKYILDKGKTLTQLQVKEADRLILL